MTEYLIFFNQQWVGDHSDEWFQSRGPTSRAVIEDMQAAGVLVYAGGLVEELDQAVSADDTSGTLSFTDGPYAESKEWLGGLTIIDVETEEQARYWCGRVAEGCGWPQEVRPFKGGSIRG
jgi:hypothetical protein